MNELIKKYATEISKISGITTIGDIEIQLHHFQEELERNYKSYLFKRIENEVPLEVDWGNWKYEPEDKEYREGADNYWSTPSILYCKMLWVSEYLNDFVDEDSEHLDTVNEVIELLNILSEENESK